MSRMLWCRKLAYNVNPVCLLVRNWHKKPIGVSWEKPEQGWTKLNYDGSCKSGSGKGSIGGVLRNHRAEFLLGYAQSIGTTNSTIAELAALRRGLELVLENGWHDRVWLEGDSKTVVEVISRRRRVSCGEVQKHVSDINLMIPELNNCIISHIYREGNRVADVMARIGHRSNKPQIWRHVPPNEIARIINEDANGKIIFRKR